MRRTRFLGMTLLGVLLLLSGTAYGWPPYSVTNCDTARTNIEPPGYTAPRLNDLVAERDSSGHITALHVFWALSQGSVGPLVYEIRHAVVSPEGVWTYDPAPVRTIDLDPGAPMSDNNAQSSNLSNRGVSLQTLRADISTDGSYLGVALAYTWKPGDPLLSWEPILMGGRYAKVEFWTRPTAGGAWANIELSDNSGLAPYYEWATDHEIFEGDDGIGAYTCYSDGESVQVDVAFDGPDIHSALIVAGYSWTQIARIPMQEGSTASMLKVFRSTTPPNIKYSTPNRSVNYPHTDYGEGTGISSVSIARHPEESPIQVAQIVYNYKYLEPPLTSWQTVQYLANSSSWFSTAPPQSLQDGTITEIYRDTWALTDSLVIRTDTDNVSHIAYQQYDATYGNKVVKLASKPSTSWTIETASAVTGYGTEIPHVGDLVFCDDFTVPYVSHCNAIDYGMFNELYVQGKSWYSQWENISSNRGYPDPTLTPMTSLRWEPRLAADAPSVYTYDENGAEYKNYDLYMAYWRDICPVFPAGLHLVPTVAKIHYRDPRPDVTYFSINNGAAQTTSRTVTLNNTCSGAPVRYQTSGDIETGDPSLSGNAAYSTAPTVTLTRGNGTKHVGFRVVREQDLHNVDRWSSWVYDDIQLNIPAPVISTFSINGGAAQTSSHLVTLNSSCYYSPTEYMASESVDFAGAEWLAYSPSVNFTLSAGNGTKTVYFKVRNDSLNTASGSDTISLLAVPTVTEFKINNGAPYTTGHTVTLNNTCSDGPTHYIASESSSFSGATWQTYSTSPSFTLSANDGVKTVYFKTKNEYGESSVLSDTITMIGLPEVTTFAINGGAASTLYQTVSLNNSCTHSPTHYMASESSSFAGATWQSYGSGPSFTLSAGSGVKTVYFKVKNNGGESAPTSDTIIRNTLPVLTLFAINNGAAQTTSPTVTLNNTCVNNPTHYMASESSSFAGASWQTYSSSPSFTLSTGNGLKTVYFKVKNDDGECVTIASDSIGLADPGAPTITSFTVNSDAAQTTSRTVTLNNTCTNTPTHYMASESPGFVGASWQTYSTAPSFTLSTSNGTKTVYFKVKNALGESGVEDYCQNWAQVGSAGWTSLGGLLTYSNTQSGAYSFFGRPITTANQTVWYDYKMADTSSANYHSWVVLRDYYPDADAQVLIDSYSDRMELKTRINGAFTTLATSASASTQGTWYSMRAVCDGANITVYRTASGTETLVLSTNACTVTGANKFWFGVAGSFQFNNLALADSSLTKDAIDLNIPAPTVTSFAVNSGAASTTTRTVTLNNSCTNNPTHYMASESSSFSGATWQTYSTAPSFTLSTMNGTKTVYFKVKNEGTESVASSDTITLSIAVPTISSFAVNSGATSTGSTSVTLDNTCTNSPTHYMASESSSFTGANWQTYAAAPNFTLSSGSGVKTVYFKVKNDGGESSVSSDTITLESAAAPAITSLSINNGAATTTSTSVTLNNVCTGSPTLYMASESPDFAGATWQTYSTAPTFTLSSGTGAKTVYFKVKNSMGETGVETYAQGWAQVGSTGWSSQGSLLSYSNLQSGAYSFCGRAISAANQTMRYDYNMANTSSADYHSWVVVRDYYPDEEAQLLLDTYRDRVELKVRNSLLGTFTTLASNTSASSSQGTWYSVRVVCNGANITVYRAERGGSETQILSTTSASPTGANKFWFGVAGAFQFDNLTLADTPKTSDTITLQ